MNESAKSDNMIAMGDCPLCTALMFRYVDEGRDAVVYQHGLTSTDECVIPRAEFERIEGTDEFYERLDAWVESIHPGRLLEELEEER